MRNIEMIKIGDAGEQLPFETTGHAAVLLPAHGVMFTARVINKKTKSQRVLEKECAAVDCAGFKDWSMPEIEVLELVVDRSRYSPALNTDFFLDIPVDWLWSKTEAAWSRSAAWFVYAHGGLVGYYDRGSYGFALAVRRIGQ